MSAHAFADEAAAPQCANYSVPTAQAELAPFAAFRIQGFDSSMVGGRRVVKYVLPRELTGDPIQVAFSGPSGQTDPDTLTGPNGTMNCAADVCQVKFQDLAIDDQKVDQFLNSTHVATSEIAFRTTVARQFKSDPGGVFSYISDCR